jgi:aminoglycoside phosphotransferase (APT) family kinase protein
VLVTSALARVVLDRFGLDGSADVGPAWRGPRTAVYPVGDRWVIKVPDGSPIALADITVQARMAPIAHAAGVLTPRLIGEDDSGELLPVPYLIFDRVPGEPITPGGRWSRPDAAVWPQLGQQLAIVHAISSSAAPPGLRTFEQSPEVDPRPWVTDLARRGLLDNAERARLTDVLEALAPIGLANIATCLCHGDVNLANLVVNSDTGELNGLLDWAGAGWLDPAWDLVGIPLNVVPAVLSGYRGCQPFPGNATAKERIAWCRLQYALHQHREGTVSPAADWATRLLDQIAHFLRQA